MTTSKSYDYLNRLQQISSAPGASGVAPVTFNYAYNDAGQRTKRTETDASYWVYQYDSLGQVISGKKYWNDGTPVPGQQFEYGFDDIGNRTSTKAGGDSAGSALRSAAYSANSLNQYTSRDVPNAFDVLGASHATNSVTVNSSPADYRRGEYFQELVSVVNSSTSVWQRVAVTNTGGSWSTGNVFVAKTPEAFSYDPDGNLTNDGRWTYTWDAENRLVNMTSGSSAPTGSKFKVDFAYDWKGRRIEKQVSTNNGSGYFAQSTNRFVYDGWNLLAVLAPNSQLQSCFIWGLDLSGSMQGAGGVGGLLAVKDATNGVHFCAYDGNGNVAALLNADGSGLTAQYEYGPFGEVLRSTGTMAKTNQFRFSTKYQDDESDMLYYGFRSYNPSTGRWLSRDPIGDVAFMKGYIKGKAQSEVRDLTKESLMPPYQFARNNAVDRIDRFGLESEPDVSWGAAPCPRGQITAYIQVVVGYIWGDGGPHVDNGSLGPKSSTSTGCPLYPLPANMSGVFQDTPSGWTGDLQFIVCRVCLESCGCQNYTRPGRGGNRTVLSDYKIVGVGPCVYWKKGDKGDLSDKDKFTQVEGPNQNWQVGMDTDFPDASKGKCFTCSRPK